MDFPNPRAPATAPYATARDAADAAAGATAATSIFDALGAERKPAPPPPPPSFTGDPIAWAKRGLLGPPSPEEIKEARQLKEVQGMLESTELEAPRIEQIDWNGKSRQQVIPHGTERGEFASTVSPDPTGTPAGPAPAPARVGGGGGYGGSGDPLRGVPYSVSDKFNLEPDAYLSFLETERLQGRITGDQYDKYSALYAKRLGTLPAMANERSRMKSDAEYGHSGFESDKAASVAKAEDLQSKILAGAAVSEQEHADARRRAAEVGKVGYEEQMARYHKTAKELSEVRIDPNRVFSSTSSRIMAAISVALGSIGASLTGGENTALRLIESAVERDIDAQKTDLKTRRGAVAAEYNALGFLRQRLKDDDAAEEALVAHRWRGIKAATASFLADSSSAQALATKGQIDQLADYKIKDTEIQQEMRAHIERKQAEAREMLRQQRAWASQDAARKKQEELALGRGARKLTKSELKRYTPGYMMNPGVSNEQKQKLFTSIAANKLYNNLTNELIDLVKSGEIESQAPAILERKRIAYDQIREIRDMAARHEHIGTQQTLGELERWETMTGPKGMLHASQGNVLAGILNHRKAWNNQFRTKVHQFARPVHLARDPMMPDDVYELPGSWTPDTSPILGAGTPNARRVVPISDGSPTQTNLTRQQLIDEGFNLDPPPPDPLDRDKTAFGVAGAASSLFGGIPAGSAALYNLLND